MDETEKTKSFQRIKNQIEILFDLCSSFCIRVRKWGDKLLAKNKRIMKYSSSTCIPTYINTFIHISYIAIYNSIPTIFQYLQYYTKYYCVYTHNIRTFIYTCKYSGSENYLHICNVKMFGIKITIEVIIIKKYLHSLLIKT